MSDRSAAAISIGGTLNDAEQVKSLIAAILIDAAGPEYGSRFRDAAEVLDHIKEAVAASGPLRLFGNEAIGGTFWNLEVALRVLGLTYSRADDGHYAYSAEVVFWEPKFDQPLAWTGNNEHAPSLTAKEIRQCLETGTLAAELDLMERAEKSEFPLLADLSALDAAIAGSTP